MSFFFRALAVPALAALSACSSSPPRVADSTSASRVAPLVVPSDAEQVTFASHDADLTPGAPTRLTGYLFRPPGEGPWPAIVALHGCGGLFSPQGHLMSRDHDWARRLRDQGYVVLLPDSFRPRGVAEICSQEHRNIRTAYERARDAYGALVYLQSLRYVLPDRVGLLGWSNGAGAVLDTVGAGTHARPRDLTHDFRVAVAFYPGCKKALERRGWAPPVAPLTILIGESDDWTPARPCVELAERAKEVGGAVDVIVYPGAYHEFDAPHTSLHVKVGVATTASRTATLGTDPAARTDAIARVPAIFASALR